MWFHVKSNDVDSGDVKIVCTRALSTDRSTVVNSSNSAIKVLRVVWRLRACTCIHKNTGTNIYHQN